ncbi:hypothetical protein [Maridesulfovibrio sp.]|uniref:hypothetical protein n=1 Tax=Maridesulfovibrio sp. TaxID=2795000 RepID=UPI003B0005E6
MSEHCLIAGISAKDQPYLTKFFKQKLRGATSTSFLTVKEQNPFYRNEVIKSTLAAFANTISKTKPDKIRIIYIPYRYSDDLKEAFFPFADIQPFDETPLYEDYVAKSFKNLDEFGLKLLDVIKGGLKIKKKPPKKHCMLLPNKNFTLENGTFRDLLKRFYFENLDDSIFNDIKKATEERCFQDSRGLVFPVTKMNEGSVTYKHEITPPEHFLSGCYRLGIYWEAGLHFDVKHPNKPLKNYTFTCNIKGKKNIPSKTTHVNIYLNDFIRLPKNKKG